MKIRELLNILDEIAPFDLAMDWDNVGLLVGDSDAEVQGIHLALDATLPEIHAMGDANVLLTHHPILFSPLQRLDYKQPEHRIFAECLKRDIALIALHTNWDMAPGGVADTLASLLELKDIMIVDDHMPIGTLGQAFTLGEWKRFLTEKLHTHPRIFFPENYVGLRRIAVAPGSAGSMIYAAKEAGANAIVLGEIKHNQIRDCMEMGMLCAVCGHYETEQPSMPVLAECLQKRFDGLQYNVAISVGNLFSAYFEEDIL